MRLSRYAGIVDARISFGTIHPCGDDIRSQQTKLIEAVATYLMKMYKVDKKTEPYLEPFCSKEDFEIEEKLRIKQPSEIWDKPLLYYCIFLEFFFRNGFQIFYLFPMFGACNSGCFKAESIK